MVHSGSQSQASRTTMKSAATALLLGGATLIVVQQTLRVRGQQQEDVETDKKSEYMVVSAQEQPVKTYSADEVKKHNNMRDGVWLIYENDVYDVTDFVEDHPGGDRIMLSAGRDLEPYWGWIVHSADAHKMLESYKIGTLRKEDRVQRSAVVKKLPKHQPPPEGGYDSLKRVHDEVSVHMQAHQALLLARDIPKSLNELELYFGQLKVHMHEEELFLIPVYKKNARHLPAREIQNNGDVYTMEHNRMKQYMAQAITLMRRLKTKYEKEGKDSITEADIVKVMDVVARHKELLRNHDGREYIDLYVGAEEGASEAERKKIWQDIFQYRAENQFIVGEISTLKEGKIEVVDHNWKSIKKEFPKKFERVLRSNEKKKTTYLGVNPFSTPGKPGDLASEWIESVIEKSKLKEFDEVARDDAKAALRHRTGDSSPGAAQADADEFIKVMLETIDECQETYLPDAVREAWANMFNLFLSTGETTTESLEKSFPADREPR